MTSPVGRRSRPYAGTGGRTRSLGPGLAIDTQVILTGTPEHQLLSDAHGHCLQLCAETSRAVSELAGLVMLPVGVIAVIVDDLHRLGAVTLQAPVDMSRNDNVSFGLMERVLRGLKAQYAQDLKEERGLAN
ncbi:DUF742 domain-containing protein [Streptomyces sp. NPDC092952]|uniref:DUF742 domain-containing protein n=1 Tax=Streptomyces sp. NPDC092952 TaxID=3366018 RepID=UPI0037F6B80E